MSGPDQTGGWYVHTALRRPVRGVCESMVGWENGGTFGWGKAEVVGKQEDWEEGGTSLRHLGHPPSRPALLYPVSWIFISDFTGTDAQIPRGVAGAQHRGYIPLLQVVSPPPLTCTGY